MSGWTRARFVFVCAAEGSGGLRVRPWVVASIGLLIAVSAIYALLTGVFEGDGKGQIEEIGSRSRDQLRDLLREPTRE